MCIIQTGRLHEVFSCCLCCQLSLPLGPEYAHNGAHDWSCLENFEGRQWQAICCARDGLNTPLLSSLFQCLARRWFLWS